MQIASLQPAGIATQHALHHADHARAIQTQHGEDGAGLDRDGIAIGGLLLRNAQQALCDQQMPGGADRQIFGNAFDEPEDEGLQQIHALP